MKDTRKLLVVKLPNELHIKIKTYCASGGITIQSLVNKLLEEGLDELNKNENENSGVDEDLLGTADCTEGHVYTWMPKDDALCINCGRLKSDLESNFEESFKQFCIENHSSSK